MEKERDVVVRSWRRKETVVAIAVNRNHDIMCEISISNHTVVENQPIVREKRDRELPGVAAEEILRT